MPVISNIGRSSPPVRFLFAVLYILLGFGAITMIVPFLMMLAGSIGSEADISDYRIVPKFLTEKPSLFARFLNDKYQIDLFTVKELYKYDLPRIDVRTGTVDEMVNKLKFDESLAKPANRKLATEYGEYLSRDIPLEMWNPGFNLRGGLIGPVNKRYQEWLKQRFGTLEALNKKYNDQYNFWAELTIPVELVKERNWAPVYHLRYRDYLEFKNSLPAWTRIPFDGTRKWQEHLRFMTDGKVEKLNEILGTTVQDFNEVTMPLTAPSHPAELKGWEDFVRRKWPLRLIHLNDQGMREYHAFIEARRKTIERVNEAYGSRHTSFDQIKWPVGEEFEGVRQSDVIDFLRGTPNLPKLTIQHVSLRNATIAFREWLVARHGGTLDGVNAALGSTFQRLDDIPLPHAIWEWDQVVSQTKHWRLAFLKSNYFEVTSFILTKGRALRNTIILIVLSIVITLTVNPLCAFALSRYNLAYGHKVLLFLLATMAFPGEVTVIPNFLLLRDLGMLNTFYALVLPGMASGFSIFILKGFFDTLPKELYEAAQLDGCGEMRIFLQITIPLCTPVLAFTALGAFTGAYGGFLFALTVCQDPNMWTIMVWLYDLQRVAPEHIKVAALVIAMIPTLLVFVTCQRVIMRGIVLPQMN